MLIGFTSGSSGSDSDLSDSTKTERRSPHGITVTQTLTSTPTSLPHPHLAVGESARVHPVSSGMTNPFFLSFFLGFRRPNLVNGLSGWRTPD